MARFVDLLPETWKGRIAIVVGILVVFLYLQGLAKERKIKRLGGRSYQRPAKLPFGVDLLVTAIRENNNFRAIEFFDVGFNTNPKSNKYTYEMNIGPQRLVFTADRDNIKAILTTQFDDYGKGEDFHRTFKPFLGNSIFATDGQKWHESRSLIRPQFVKDRLSDINKFEHHSKALLPYLRGDGSTVDFQTLIFCFTIDTATDFLLGKSIDSLGNEEAAFKVAFDHVQFIQGILIRSAGLDWAIPKPGYWRALKVIHEFTDTFIDEALALRPEELKKGQDANFLHSILEYSRDKQVLRDEIMAMLIAGRDTTAGTLSWLFYEFSLQPRIVTKLRQEIIDLVGLDRQPNYEDLKNMTYLGRCLKEILRMYPATPVNVRVALKDTTLPRGGGPDGNSPVGIVKGTPIGYSTYMLQRRPDFYPQGDYWNSSSRPELRADQGSIDPSFPPVEDFVPERWEKWNPQSWTYIPFNGGPRLCVGQQFALMEMSYLVVRILQTYSRVEPRIAQRPQLRNDLVLQPAQNVKLAFFR